MKDKTLFEIFLEIAQPNEYGYSRVVTMEELIKHDIRFNTTNGGGWCRVDSGPSSKYHWNKTYKSNKIDTVQLAGFNKRPLEKKIRKDILNTIKKQRCVVLDVGTQIECDHKNGHYDDPIDKQKLEHFQPLHKTVNNSKKQHCKECKETGLRYDATKLGYSESFIFGDEHSKNCEGCYWYDPHYFNSVISKDFKKPY